jgi:hypothetical protein
LKSALPQTRTQAVSEQGIIFCKQNSHERIVAWSAMSVVIFGVLVSDTGRPSSTVERVSY